MTRHHTPILPYGMKFTPKETPQEKTTAVAMKIIAEDQQRQLDQIARLKAARIHKESAEALVPTPPRRKSRRR